MRTLIQDPVSFHVLPVIPCGDHELILGLAIAIQDTEFEVQE